jgi:hypothetical protein
MTAYFEPDRYTVRVIEQKVGKTEKGTPGLFFTVVPLVRNTPDGDVHQPHETRTIAFYFSTVENTRISIQQLRNLGWQGTSFIELAASADSETGWSLVGQELAARCEHEEWTNSDGEARVSEKWRFVIGAGLQVNASEHKDLLDLDARFGHLLNPSAPKRPAAPPQQQQPQRRQSMPTNNAPANSRVTF